MSQIVDVDDVTFEREVMERSHEVPVVVDFWAEWCGPCKQLGPMLEEQAKERGFVLAKVDVDRAQSLAMAFRVQSIPFVVAFRNGEPVKHFMGVIPRPELNAFLDEVCGPGSPAAGEDSRREEEQDPAKAEEAYRAKLEEESRDPIANLGLARLLLERDDHAGARKHLEAMDPKKSDDHADEVSRLTALLDLRALASPLGDEAAARAAHEAAPDDPEKLYELGCVLAAGGNYPEALAQLLSAGERSKELAKTRVREAMVHVFYALGSRDPLADEYRDKLTTLVF